MIIARHLRIEGRVQGVGYRAWAEAMANEIGVVGWVRNRSDGTVEAVVEAEADKIAAFVEAAWRGPPLSGVSDIIVKDVAIEEHASFSLRPTG